MQNRSLDLEFTLTNIIQTSLLRGDVLIWIHSKRSDSCLAFNSICNTNLNWRCRKM